MNNKQMLKKLLKQQLELIKLQNEQYTNEVCKILLNSLKDRIENDLKELEGADNEQQAI